MLDDTVLNHRVVSHTVDVITTNSQMAYRDNTRAIPAQKLTEFERSAFKSVVEDASSTRLEAKLGVASGSVPNDVEISIGGAGTLN